MFLLLTRPAAFLEVTTDSRVILNRVDIQNIFTNVAAEEMWNNAAIAAFETLNRFIHYIVLFRRLRENRCYISILIVIDDRIDC